MSFVHNISDHVVIQRNMPILVKGGQNREQNIGINSIKKTRDDNQRRGLLGALP